MSQFALFQKYEASLSLLSASVKVWRFAFHSPGQSASAILRAD
jgi:hypothetical protein